MTERDIVTIQSASRANYAGMVVLSQFDRDGRGGVEEKVFLGKQENYDDHGNYDNSDNSLIYISRNLKLGSFLDAGPGWVLSQQSMIENGAFTPEDYAEFAHCKETVLKEFVELQPKLFEIDMDRPGSGVPFRYPDWTQREPEQKQRLFVDMDGTLAVFKPVDELETLYEQGYFLNLEPHENVVEAVGAIIANHPEVEVNILSAVLMDSEYALAEKNAWLDKYLPELDAAHRVFVPCGSDKKEGIPGGIRPDDFLLDDYTKNLNDWEPPARGIKLLNAINHTRGSWAHDRIRYDRAPTDLAEGIVSVMQGREHIYDERVEVYDIVARGDCGSNLTWTLDENGTLTITGEGAMYNYAPWNDLKAEIRQVVIKEGVTEIGALAFQDCKNLESVVIPNTVTGIGNGAFMGCEALTSVTIPDSVTKLEDWAFHRCPRLETVIIGNGITDIRMGAFAGCTALRNVKLPDGLLRIGSRAFRECPVLKEIKIPATVIAIGYRAFSRSGLIRVSVPASVADIGDQAFMRLPSGAVIETANPDLFIADKHYDSETTALRELVAGTGMERTAPLDRLKIRNQVVDAYSGQANCELIAYMDPEGYPAGYIKYAEFRDNPHIQFMEVAEEFRHMGVATRMLQELQSLYPGQEIEWGMTTPDGTKLYEAVTYTVVDEEVKVLTDQLNGARAVLEMVEAKLSVLNEIEEPTEQDRLQIGSLGEQWDGLTNEIWTLERKIDGRSVEKVFIKSADQPEKEGTEMAQNNWPFFIANGKCGDDLTWTLDTNGTLTISGQGHMVIDTDYSPWYDHRDRITNVVIEEGVYSIAANAFAHCEEIKQAKIAGTVTEIGAEAFLWCKNLESVTIPESVTAIHSHAFMACHSLKEIHIPYGVKGIGPYAFSNIADGSVIYTEKPWLLNDTNYNPHMTTVQKVEPEFDRKPERELTAATVDLNEIPIEQIATIDYIKNPDRQGTGGAYRQSDMFTAVLHNMGGDMTTPVAATEVRATDGGLSRIKEAYRRYDAAWNDANLKDDFQPKIAILQLREGESNHDRRFLSLEQLERFKHEKPDCHNYELVYVRNQGMENVHPEFFREARCNELYDEFNSNGLRPRNYYGHSLSVGDVIVFMNNFNEHHAYFVDNVGFQKLPDDFLTRSMAAKIRNDLDIRIEGALYESIEQYQLNRAKHGFGSILSEAADTRYSYISNEYAHIFELADRRGIIMDMDARGYDYVFDPGSNLVRWDSKTDPMDTFVTDWEEAREFLDEMTTLRDTYSINELRSMLEEGINSERAVKAVIAEFEQMERELGGENAPQSLQQLWDMVNGAETVEDVAEAEKAIRESDISNDDYNDLMMALSAQSRDAYRNRGAENTEQLRVVPGLSGRSAQEIEQIALDYAREKLVEAGLANDVTLLGASVYGSRSREGLYHDGSDIDVVISYDGEVREDDFFNILHGDEMAVDGIPLDINPISLDKTGTLEAYMEKAEAYLDEKEGNLPHGEDEKGREDFTKTAVRFTDIAQADPGRAAMLDKHFELNSWQLQRWENGESSGYNIYFGEGVQVDNHYEYLSPYLLEEGELLDAMNQWNIDAPKKYEGVIRHEDKSSFAAQLASGTFPRLEYISISDTATGWRDNAGRDYGQIDGYVRGYNVEFRNRETGEIDYNSTLWVNGTIEGYHQRNMDAWGNVGYEPFEVERSNGWEPTGRAVFRGYGKEEYDFEERETYIITEGVAKEINGWMRDNRLMLKPDLDPHNHVTENVKLAGVAIGQTVYGYEYPRTDIKVVAPEVVESIKLEPGKITIETDGEEYTPADIGKRIFLSREEAERALEPELPLPTDKSKIVCLDVETTGLRFAEDEILQLSIVDGNGEVLFNEYIKPKNLAEWPEAEAINGISPAMVAEKPNIDAYIPRLNEIMANAELIVGYNHERFDMTFIRNAGITLPETMKTFDVMHKFAPVYGQWDEVRGRHKNQKLAFAAEYYGYQGNGNFHDSLEDVRATLHCYFAMTDSEYLLEVAKGLINDFCREEYDNDADFSDLEQIGIGATDAPPVEAFVNLVDYRLERYLYEELIESRQYDSLEALISNELGSLDFHDLLNVTDEQVAKAKGREVIEMKSLEEFLGERGLSSPVSDFMLDKTRNPHGLTQRQRETLEKEAEQARAEYAARREAAIAEYAQLVAEGKLREPTAVERLLKAAAGHEDLDSTQAARRALEKRGIDWQAVLAVQQNRDLEAVYRIDGTDYLHIQTSDEGYDYTIYDENMKELDGGQLDNPALSISDAREEILALHELSPANVENFDLEAFEALREAADAREQEEIQLRSRVIEAMEVAGYTYNHLESHDGYQNFNGEGNSMTFDTFADAAEWLDGVVFDDPEITERVEFIMNGTLYEEPLVDIYDLAYDGEGYVHFTVAVDGYELEGLFRVLDPANGEDMELVSIDHGDRHPIIERQWDRISDALYDMTYDHYNQLVDLEFEQFPDRKQRVIRAFEAAGFTYNEAESQPGRQMFDRFVVGENNGVTIVNFAHAERWIADHVMFSHNYELMQAYERIMSPEKYDLSGLADDQRLTVAAMDAAGFEFDARSKVGTINGLIFSDKDNPLGYPLTFKTWDEARDWIDSATFTRMEGGKEILDAKTKILYPDAPDIAFEDVAGKTYEYEHYLYEVIDVKDGVVYLQNVNNDMHTEIPVGRFLSRAVDVTEREALYAENPVGEQDWYFNDPERGEVFSVYFNPNSNAGGQYVHSYIPYELIREAARMGDREATAEEFFEMINERAKQELIDIDTPEFKQLLEHYKTAKPDFVYEHGDFFGEGEPTMKKLMEAAENGLKQRAEHSIYLFGDGEGVWRAEVLPEARPGGVKLATEGNYPVEVYYYRTDINGSGVVELAIFENREALLGTLNFWGEAGFIPTNLWDYDEDKSDSEELRDLFSAALARREKMVLEANDPMVRQDLAVERIEKRIAEINAERDRLYDEQYRYGYIAPRQELAKLYQEERELNQTLEVVAHFDLSTVVAELDRRDGDTGLSAQGRDRLLAQYSYYVLGRAERVLQAGDKELTERVDLGEKVIAEWEKENHSITAEQNKLIYAAIRNKAIPLEDLESIIRQALDGKFEPMPNRYYHPEFDFDGTADQLFTEARNGYIESPEALAKLEEILSNPVEQKLEQAFYVRVLREIAEDKGDKPYVFAQMKKDILDGVSPEEVQVRDGLTLEVRDENGEILVALSEFSAERDATGATVIAKDDFLNMTAQDFETTVNSIYAYSMVDHEREDSERENNMERSEPMADQEKNRVAIESTDDYTDTKFHKNLIDADIQNEDGSHGKVVDYYRIATIGENGRMTALDERVFASAEAAEAAVAGDPALELVSYDTLVHEAGKKLGQLTAEEPSLTAQKEQELNAQAVARESAPRDIDASLPPKDQLKQRLENGVRSVLDSEKFKNWLNTGGKLFYNNYSFRNAILVWLQKPDATYVMGYDKWKEFGRNVQQGATGAKVFIPLMASEKVKGGLFRSIKNNLLDQLDKDPNLKTANYRLGSSNLEFTMSRSNRLIGIRVKDVEQQIGTDEQVKRFIERSVIGKIPTGFTVGTVFDAKDVAVPEFLWVRSGFTKDEVVTDEKGNPVKNKRGETKIVNTPERQARFQPDLDTRVVAKDPEKMKKLLEACVAASERKGVPVSFVDKADDDTLKRGASGYYSRELSEDKPNGYIVIDNGLEISEKCACLLHEMGHADLHKNLDTLAEKMGEEKISKSMREIQAEAVAYSVASTFGIETETSSFNYLAAYARGFDLQDFQKSLDVIYRETQALTKDIQTELDLRGLNLDLTEKPKEMVDAQTLETMSTMYLDFAKEKSESVQTALAELPNLVVRSKDNPELLDVLKHQKENLDARASDLNIIMDGVEALNNAATREDQEQCIERIESAMERVEWSGNAFEVLSEGYITLYEQAQGGLKADFDKNPAKTLEAMKKDYPALENLSKPQLQYIAASKFVARELSKLLRTNPQEFVDKVTERAGLLSRVAAKNGAFVEVTFCEQWTDKPIFEEGTLCAPKIADAILENSEKQIRGWKAEAEQRGEYFPYAKCDVTIYAPNKNGGLTALHTRVDIGDGAQTGLKDHLEQVCKRGAARKELLANFQEALTERAYKKKIAVQTIGDKVQTVVKGDAKSNQKAKELPDRADQAAEKKEATVRESAERKPENNAGKKRSKSNRDRER